MSLFVPDDGYSVSVSCALYTLLWISFCRRWAMQKMYVLNDS